VSSTLTDAIRRTPASHAYQQENWDQAHLLRSAAVPQSADELRATLDEVMEDLD
jgi:hypothetical protein